MKRFLILNSAPVEDAACRVGYNSTALVPLARPISVRIDAALSCNLAKERSLQSWNEKFWCLGHLWGVRSCRFFFTVHAKYSCTLVFYA